MTTRYIMICACEKQLFRVGRISSSSSSSLFLVFYNTSDINIILALRVRECTQVIKQRICFCYYSKTCSSWCFFFISTIVKCDLLRIVITLHHANLLSKRSKSRCHPSPTRGKSLFHLVICSFRVSTCDKKNLK